MVWLEGLGQLKNPMTSELDAATFRLVAYCLNQLRYRVAPSDLGTSQIPSNRVIFSSAMFGKSFLSYIS
jgi:hypothetical protein